ncbi:DNA methyltransferase [Legionella londiniensis]|uniref:site-specific DNA-methyltransferase (cytosine-N(4)-specific) n=1 Tax=Legionella londiniensis TaxID=45068 RepID=A0A0W0VJ18_9GAMM|nr:DNA methyltransferase [Legionella londiniensis]KTD20115.1 DNA methylase [Legionella londiniensis]STX94282.1 putative methylase [Legionella londiniensis]
MLIKNENRIPLNQIQHADSIYLSEIQELDHELFRSFGDSILVDNNLTRKLVSFQASKSRSYYRWYKFKEAFSADLVEYIFNKYHFDSGRILDPFAGSGTTLFASADMGYKSTGIELLPVGQHLIKANLYSRIGNTKNLISELESFLSEKSWCREGERSTFNVLRITQGAYPEETCKKIQRYLSDIRKNANESQQILYFALLCILESVSYTRKDGQYLRWDYRSGRSNGKSTFDKGKILDFDSAITGKLSEIIKDLYDKNIDENLLFKVDINADDSEIELLSGSCLNILPKLSENAYSGIMTSPPYCNRYDYTRTYALEHAMLGIDEGELINLRQSMLSCTVENKKKELLKINDAWSKALSICDNTPLLQKILTFLEYKKDKKELNNAGISRMVRGYFYEMACVIQESYRVLSKNSYMVMVNDNVRYAGVSISVDLLLSSIARDMGFSVENILVLPKGKGNSSQQMGSHGRDALRKCVYVWRKVK